MVYLFPSFFSNLSQNYHNNFFADTGMDFPEMAAHIAKLDALLYRITPLRHPHGFEWLMFDEPKQKPSCLERRARLGVPPYGNGPLKRAVRKYLAQAQNPKIHHGKQTVKQLVSQGAGVRNIEITGKNIKSFERVARKYGVDFALKKDPAQGKYLVFFKARDADALNAAFAEYAGESVELRSSVRG